MGEYGPLERPEGEAELSPREQTLYFGRMFSACGNCGGNADWRAVRHESCGGEDGYGVVWRYVTMDGGSRERVMEMRPDLEWRDPDNNGVTAEVEDRALDGLEVGILPMSVRDDYLKKIVPIGLKDLFKD